MAEEHTHASTPARTPLPPLPPRAASAVNLMAHPTAGAAALSALGIGVASQAFGAWMGALAAAAEASHRLWQPLLDAAGKAAEPALRAEPARAAREALQAEGAAAAEAAAATAKGEAPRLRIVSRTAGPDDLKAIAGVGPKLEKVLNGLGVSTYAQIAAWTPADIERIEGYCGFPGRIARDGWVRTAGNLAAGSLAAGNLAADAARVDGPGKDRHG